MNKTDLQMDLDSIDKIKELSEVIKNTKEMSIDRIQSIEIELEKLSYEVHQQKYIKNFKSNNLYNKLRGAINTLEDCILVFSIDPTYSKDTVFIIMDYFVFRLRVAKLTIEALQLKIGFECGEEKSFASLSDFLDDLADTLFISLKNNNYINTKQNKEDNDRMTQQKRNKQGNKKQHNKRCLLMINKLCSPLQTAFEFIEQLVLKEDRDKLDSALFMAFNQLFIDTAEQNKERFLSLIKGSANERLIMNLIRVILFTSQDECLSLLKLLYSLIYIQALQQEQSDFKVDRKSVV